MNFVYLKNLYNLYILYTCHHCGHMSMNATASYNCSCGKNPCLNDNEIALLNDANALINMHINPDNLTYKVCTEILKRIEKPEIDCIYVNCLVKPIVGEPMYNDGLCMTTLEKELLLMEGALRPPNVEKEGLEDTIMLNILSNNKCFVFELASLRPLAKAFYTNAYENLMAEYKKYKESEEAEETEKAEETEETEKAEEAEESEEAEE